MALYSGGDRDDNPRFGVGMREGDGVIDVLIILLLVGFSLALWFVCGALRPMLDDPNPSLMAHPAPASGPYIAGSVQPSQHLAGR
ncbi:MAG: hypothetical protein JSR78_13875 [Proteobacteria bacterium]|nr:hypothetical protein [Pseudomonadota bacterium]